MPGNDLLTSCPPFYRYKPVLDLEWLNTIARDPQPLQNYLASRENRFRLGLYFEDLIGFYLQTCPTSNTRRVSRRLKMGSIDRQVPFGELDFLIEQEDQLCHLEVAVKFYLGHEDESGTWWTGTNPADSWSRKINHMRQHQLPLSNHLAVARDRSVRQFYWVKGRLFQPWKKCLRPPSGARADTPDIWIRAGMVPEWVDSSNHSWIILPRARWLGGLSSDEIEMHAINGDKLTDLVRLRQKTSDHALMLESVPDAGRTNRTIIVGDNWPCN